MIRLYPVKTFNIFKSIFNKWIWSFNTDKKEIYLTFDDGPIPEITPWVLKRLENYKAKATFFCIGDNIFKNPDEFNQIIEKGHRVGNHTYNHLKGWNTNTVDYIENTLRAEKFFPYQQQKLFRPPYGKITNKQSKEILKLNYTIVMWDVLSGDFDQNISNEQCLANVTKHAENGSIVVFHDSLKSQEKLQYVLPKVLKHYAALGYSFCQLNDKEETVEKRLLKIA